MPIVHISGPAQQFRVALLGANLNQSGAEKQLFYIARSLASVGITVRVYTILSGGHFDQLLRDEGIEVHSFGKVPYPPLRLVHLAVQLAAFRPHIVQAIPAFMNLYAALAGRIVGAVTIGGLRSDFSQCRASYGRITSSLMRSCDALAVNSRKARKDLIEAGLATPDRVHFLQNIIDMTPFAPRVNRAREVDEFVALFIGRLIPVKRVDLFLRALASARKRHSLIRGVIAGSGSQTQAMRDLATSLGLADTAIQFLGHYGDVATLFRQSNCLVLTSDCEGCPNVVIEAMAAGLPVIATPAGDAPDMVKNDTTGMLVPFGDSEAIADALVRLASDAEACRSFGRAGYDFIRRTYAFPNLSDRLLSIYRSAAGSRSLRWPPLKSCPEYEHVNMDSSGE